MLEIKTESLPVPLTKDELREFGQRAAREVKELGELQGAAKLAAAEYKKQIKEKEAAVRDLSECINSEREYRPVAIHEEIDRAKGFAFIYRDDTGALLRTRPLTPSEMQTSMENLY